MTVALRDSAARLAPLILLFALVILVAGAASFAPLILQRRVTQALIMLVGVVGLYVFAGNSGVFSFGNVGFMAIAAYVSALVTMAPGRSQSSCQTCRNSLRSNTGRRQPARSPAEQPRPRLARSLAFR